MASYDRRTITSMRHEYVCRKPVHISEFNKACHAAILDVQKRLGITNEVKASEHLMVDADDEHVIIRWEQEIPE